ncbi:MAG: hypothetical protein V1792_14985 [Pseudomonadota bacterium]
MNKEITVENLAELLERCLLDIIHGSPTAFVEMRSLEGRALAINPDKKITVMGVSQGALKGMTERPAD